MPYSGRDNKDEHYKRAEGFLLFAIDMALTELIFESHEVVYSAKDFKKTIEKFRQIYEHMQDKMNRPGNNGLISDEKTLDCHKISAAMTVAILTCPLLYTKDFRFVYFYNELLAIIFAQSLIMSDQMSGVFSDEAVFMILRKCVLRFPFFDNVNGKPDPRKAFASALSELMRTMRRHNTPSAVKDSLRQEVGWESLWLMSYSYYEMDMHSRPFMEKLVGRYLESKDSVS